MRFIRLFVTTLILFIAVGAALYTQRLEVLEWIREQTQPELPEAIEYEQLQKVQEQEIPLIPEESVDPTPASDSQTNETDEEIIITPEKVEEEIETPVPDTQEEVIAPVSLNLAVPFTPQAPHANWSLPYKEACEEASLYMAHRFYQGTPEGLMNADQADKDLLQIVAFENELFGFYEDTTAQQIATVAELMFGYSTQLIENPSIDDIKNQLVLGHPVMVPVAGRLLGNPYFTPPGPIYHMLVIRGFTQEGQFITNDPGTYRGEAYVYDFATIVNAMHDWNGGEEITAGSKVVLVIYP